MLYYSMHFLFEVLRSLSLSKGRKMASHLAALFAARSGRRERVLRYVPIDKLSDKDLLFNVFSIR